MSPQKKTKSSVTFEDPPVRPQRYDWQKIAEALRERPNEWALIFTQDKRSLATAVRQGAIAALRDDIEVRTANNVREPERLCDMYLRYVPSKEK